MTEFEYHHHATLNELMKVGKYQLLLTSQKDDF